MRRTIAKLLHCLSDAFGSLARWVSPEPRPRIGTNADDFMAKEVTLEMEWEAICALSGLAPPRSPTKPG